VDAQESSIKRRLGSVVEYVICFSVAKDAANNTMP
jgi:hypothetical protein